LPAVEEAINETELAGIHANIGACYLELGKTKQALEHLDNSLCFKNNESEPLFLSGLAYE